MAARRRSNTESRQRSCRNHLTRQTKMHVFARYLDFGKFVIAGRREPGDDRLDELFRRRSAGRETDRRVAVEQAAIELALAVDQRRRSAAQSRDLHEPLRVRARLRADYEDERCSLP